MLAISGKLLATVVGALFVSVAAVPLPFVWPRGGEEGLKGELRESGVNNRDEIEDTVDLIHSLTKAEGDELMALDEDRGFMTAGIRSSRFKVLMAMGLPWGYTKLGGEDLDTQIAVHDGLGLLRMGLCVANAANCGRARHVLGKSNFGMAIPFLAMKQFDVFPAELYHKFFQNLIVDSPPPSEKDIQRVASLLSLYDQLDMMAIIKQTRVAIGLPPDASEQPLTPKKTIQLFLAVWNQLSNIAEPGRAAHQRRDQREAEAVAAMRPPVMADPVPAPLQLGPNNHIIDDHRPPAQFRVWGADADRVDDGWQGGA